MKKLYETQVKVVGGREGKAKSTDGRLEVSLGFPPELGGSQTSTATNPEQLFAAGCGVLPIWTVFESLRGIKKHLNLFSFSLELRSLNKL